MSVFVAERTLSRLLSSPTELPMADLHQVRVSGRYPSGPPRTMLARAVEIKGHPTGCHLRIDDAEADDFWLELRVPRHIVDAMQGMMEAATVDPAEVELPTAQRKAQRRAWILTHSGKRDFQLDVAKSGIEILDIAHSLSNLCRFQGHCREFYSVAQHSALVALQVPQEHRLAALLHDAAEAYLCDLPAPVKHVFGYPGYQHFEAKLLEAIASVFGFELPLAKEIDIADLVLLATEARDLFDSLPPEWQHRPENGYRVLPNAIVPLPPAEAKALFLDVFEQATGRQLERRPAVAEEEPIERFTGQLIDAFVLKRREAVANLYLVSGGHDQAFQLEMPERLRPSCEPFANRGYHFVVQGRIRRNSERLIPVLQVEEIERLTGGESCSTAALNA